MIDIRLLRDAPEAMRAALARRHPDLVGSVDRMLAVDASRRELLRTVEHLKAERNTKSSEVAGRKQAGTDASDLLEELKVLSARIKSLDEAMRAVDAELEGALLRVPNPPLPHVLRGDASANQVVRTWGEAGTLPFAAQTHWDLGTALGILDLPTGAKLTGSGFPLFAGQGARLVRALTGFMLDLHTAEHGYTEIAPPYLVNADSARGTGQLPDHQSEMYVTTDGFYLIPTAEVPLTNIHRDDVLRDADLPIAYVAYTPCFRREAGAHGKDTRGLIRVHQFDKVELVRFVRPEDSPAELERLLGHAETVLQRLEVPYRVVALATGDLGFASAQTYDLEVWAPGVAMWLEVSSASTFTDFQARRANIRYRSTPDAKPSFVHTLNASGVALPRTIIALMENHQQEDGSIRIPAALVPYVGTDRLTRGDA